MSPAKSARKELNLQWLVRWKENEDGKRVMENFGDVHIELDQLIFKLDGFLDNFIQFAVDQPDILYEFLKRWNGRTVQALDNLDA